MKTLKTEIQEVIEKLNNGIHFENNDFQFVFNKSNNAMFKYDCKRNTYKFYSCIDKFSSDIVKFLKRGY